MYPFMFLWGFLSVVRRNFYKAWVRDESSFITYHFYQRLILLNDDIIQDL